MSHYAIIKAKRKDKVWKFIDNSNDVNEYRNKALTETFYDEVYGLRDLWSPAWLLAIKFHGVISDEIYKGYEVYWEGVLDVGILGNGCYLQTPLFEEKCLIKEVNYDIKSNTVTYHIDYTVINTDKEEASRQLSVEEWFKYEYPNHSKFSELINHKYDRNKYKDEHFEFIKNRYNLKPQQESSTRDPWWKRMFS